MPEVSDRVEKLSPQQRKLLELMLLRKRRQAARRQRIPRRAPAPREPLSFAQQRLWFLDRLAPGNPYYNMPRAIRFRGRLRLDVLRRAFDEIVRRHEALRTVFTTFDDQAVQVIGPPFSPELPAVDLSGLPEERARSRAEAAGTAFVRLPFDLERGPLLQLLLVVLGGRERVLFLSIHHIVSDGWSQMVLARELAEIYRALAAGEPSPLPELPVQYADFAVWQRGWLDEEILRAELDHWVAHLEGAPRLLELPTDRPRPSVQTLTGAHRYFTLEPETSRALHALSEEEGGSLYMTLAAAFRTLLMRLSGATDLVVGSPIANRHRREIEGLIGFFVNMLVMRTDLSGDPTFRQLLRQVKEVTLGAYENQDLPFERLVEAIKPERDLATTPIFQVMFNLLNFPHGAHRLPDLEIDPWQLGTGTSKYDLSLYMFGDENRLAGFFEYSTDLFDGTTIERTLRQLETLLAGVVADPDRPLSELPLLPASERHRLLREAAPEPSAAPAAAIPDQVAARAARTPTATAVEAVDGSLTYGELHRRSAALARALRCRGVTPESRVAVVLDRRADLVVTLLALLRTGGAYVPVDPDDPEARVAFVLEDSRPRLVLTEERHRERLETSGAPTLVLDVDALTAEEDGDEGEPEPIDLDRTAYVIYTSGSTGRPKGVAVPHRTVARFLAAMAERPGLGPDDTLLAITTLSFDISALELYLPLVRGARLVVATAEEAADPVRLRARLESSGVTAMQATPITWRLLVDAGWRGGPGFRALSGGEALGRALADELLVRSGEVWNLYGPTETTIWSSVARVGEGGSVPLGRAISGTRLYVADPRLRPSPTGAPGELLIAGEGVARGYVDRPALTAERFVPDPWADDPAGVGGARLYRTGDLVRRRAGGELTFHGRIDHQVKLHGFRIELGEIEAALEARPEIDGAVVVADRRGELGDRLVACVTAVTGREIDSLALRRELAESLPEHMVPSVVRVLDAFPRTGSGKVDRRALLPVAEADGSRVAEDAGAEPPDNPLERHLEAHWCRVLGVERVGRGERFFDLGGNSIQAAIAVNALQQELGEVLHVTALFQAQTLRDLAAFLEREYPDATRRLRRRLGEDVGPAPAAAGRERGVGPFDVLTLRRLAAEAAGGRTTPGAADRRREPLPPALFVLSPPRSGSTLLRVMLAGHSRLFSPPELELLGYDTLGRRRDDLDGPHRFAREGLLRAVMELEGCGAEEAVARLDELESRDAPVAEVYGYLRTRSGRTVVDKTSTYALDPAALDRAETLFRNARYVHLVRHPCATIQSYVDVRLDQFLRFANPFSPRQQAELLWTVGHQNLLRFFEGVPEERRRTILFEDLVTDPEGTVRELCDWLGLEPEPSMLRPYEGERMTDGLYPQSRMHGDPLFHRHDTIDPRVAEGWRGRYAVEDLAPVTRGLAGRFGYPVPRPEPAEGVTARPEGEGVELSFAQERLWLIHHIEPGSPAYHVPVAVRLEGPVEATALERALGDLAARHEVLRTSYGIRDGRPLARLVGGVRPALRRVDLRSLAPDRREAALASLARREALRLFDLARPPLLRTVLVRLEDEGSVLLVTLHHIVADGWSLGVLVRDLAALYEAARLGAPDPLGELPVQFSDYAAWQRRRLEAGGLDRLLDYWRGRLAGRSLVLELPTDRPRPVEPSIHGGEVSLRVGRETAEGLARAGREHGTTLFTVCAAALQALLHRISQQDEAAVGVAVANRPRAELEGLIGCFVNLLVLAQDTPGDRPFGDLLEAVRDDVAGAFEHQELPFEKLVDELQPRRDIGRHPLFQVLFLFQNAPVPEIELPGLALRGLDTPDGTSPYDLTITVTERAGGLAGSLEYRRDLFDPSTAERWSRAFERLLSGVAALTGSAAGTGLGLPAASLDALPVMAPEALRQVVHGWNDTALPAPALGERVSRRFLATLRERPGTTALVAGDRSVDYAELGRRVGALSRRLREAGVGPDDRVGVLLGRSADLVVALLAVLDAGGAYLPLDPEYPPERLAFMLEDSGASLLVTTGALEERVTAPPTVLRVDDPGLAGEPNDAEPLAVDGPPEALAYTIYTSGSTGRPKGVMVGHRALSGFLAAMDDRLAHRADDDRPVVWLAVTSVSFDISVLELLWTISRGHTVVLDAAGTAAEGVAPAPAPAQAPERTPRRIERREMSLAYFASEAGGADPYRLLLDGARFADRRGFRAVWTPERHFHAFGGPFPNPAVTGALVASVTERIAVRAGSVVLPLTSPVRVAEDWALLDAVSGGRVGIAFASGWHANDFVLAPDRYADRKETLRRDVARVRALWRGEAVPLTNGLGETVEVRTFPRPVQPELPTWITSSGNPRTFALAGEIGAGVLTHLLGQGPSGLPEKIAVYREALARHHPGHPGHVAVMVHTFVAPDETPAREALLRYLRSSADLIASLAKGAAVEDLDPAELDRLLEGRLARYLGGASLIGSADRGRELLEELSAAGADEVACLVDFGVETGLALDALEALDALRRDWRGAREDAEPAVAVPAETTPGERIGRAIARHGVTHLQCTPSLARILVLDPESRPALGRLRALLVGGEALSAELARELSASLSGALLDVYGPTETTVWSTSHEVREGEAPVPIGRPVANTSVHLLDRSGRPVLPGSPGELTIGGVAVTRGYHERPALTAERFVPDPFADDPAGVGGARLYRTGDLATRRDDGALLFRGRVDEQVKIRGHRMEPGEIVARLEARPEVREAAVLALTGSAGSAASAGDTRLVAFVVPARRAALRPIADPDRRRELLAGRLQVRLPNGMVVTHLSDFQAGNMYREVFEVNTYLRHGVRLDDGACVFDVGANVGMFTLFAHQTSRDATVFAFEPMPDTHAALAANVALYDLDVTLHDAGVSDRPGEAEFTFYPHMPGMSSRFADPEEDKRETASLIRAWLERDASEAARSVLGAGEVDEYLDQQFESRRVRRPLITLSQVIRERRIERIDLLKIDVERSEMHVLRGIEADHWPRVRQVVIEVHGDGLRDQCRSLLESRGFEVAVDDHVVVEEDDDPTPVRVYMLYARRPEDGGVTADGGARPASGAADETAPPALDVSLLREALRRELPEPMVPTRFVEIGALPRTPNGKLDRRALAALEGEHTPVSDLPYAPPDTETERIIGGVFEEILDLESVGIDDNFFDLGGNSVLIVEANSRLRAALGRSISVVEMFRHPTVRALASHLEEIREAGSAAGADDPAVPGSLAVGRSRAEARLVSLRRRAGRPGAAGRGGGEGA